MAKTYGYMQSDATQNKLHTATAFSTQDDTGTPQASPLTVSSSEIDIVVPENAAELVIVNTDQDLRVSEVTGMARYFVLPVDQSLVLQVSNTDNVYLKRDGSSDCTVQFYFRLINASA